MQIEVGKLPALILQRAGNYTSSSTAAISASFATIPHLGNIIILSISIAGNSADGNPTFTVTDNATVPNTYTSQVYQSGAANGLSAAVFSAPITSLATPTFTVTATEAGDSTAWTLMLEIYEVQGLASATQVSHHGFSGGTFPTISEGGTFQFSAIGANFSSGSGNMTYGGTLDRTNTDNGAGSGNGAWNNPNAVNLSYAIAVGAGFS